MQLQISSLSDLLARPASGLALGLGLFATLAVAGSASASFVISQQAAPAPTYSNLITFDEPGTPTGVVPNSTWSDLGITITDGVNPNAVVIGDVSGTFPWINTGNVAEGSFGIQLSWESAVTELSFQAWDPSGPPTPFGGGVFVVLLDENDNELDGGAFTGAWGGLGNTWFNITTSGASSFRKAVIFNNSFGNSTSWVDNISWNAIPSPGALALLALGALGGGRRRR